MEPFQIDAGLVTKILELIDHGLTKGLGEPEPGQMCVEHVVCVVLGEPYGDKPSCVSHSVQRYNVGLNESPWSSNLARAKGLRRVAIAQLGSKGIDEKRFRTVVVEQMIRRIVPIALRAAAELMPIQRESLVAAALRCEQEGTQAAAAHARETALAAHTAQAHAVAAYAAVDNAAGTAERVVDYNIYGVAAEAANAVADASQRDEVLSIAAEIAVEALRECGSPGVAFMPDVE